MPEGADIRTYVINLARSADRRASITAQLSRYDVDFELVEAVDGRDFDMEDPQLLAGIEPSFRTRDGWRPVVAACAMSHLEVYRRVLADGSEAALVLEDDVQVPADLATLAAAVAQHLLGAAVGLLSFECPEPIRFPRTGGADMPSGRRLVRPVEVGQPVSAAAYVITREACERITKGQNPVRATADAWGQFYGEGMLETLHCVLPMPVAKDPRFQSTLMYYPDSSLKARLLGLITRYGVSFLHDAVSRRRQRIWRRYNRIELVEGSDAGD